MQLWVVVGLRCKVSGAFRRQRNRGEDSGASDSHVSQPALPQGSLGLFPAGCPTAFTYTVKRSQRRIFYSEQRSPLPVLPKMSYSARMPEETKQASDSDRIQGSQPAEPGDYGEKLRQLEADVKDLTNLFKHLLNSSPHGEQLIFMTMARIEEQDDAVLKFNETFRDILKRKGLE